MIWLDIRQNEKSGRIIRHYRISGPTLYNTNSFCVNDPFPVSVVVNMILINMMMAIINMAFEEIKEQKGTYQNKFEIIEYIKRSVKEITGVQ